MIEVEYIREGKHYGELNKNHPNEEVITQQEPLLPCGVAISSFYEENKRSDKYGFLH